MSEIINAVLYEAGNGSDGLPRVVFENDDGDKVILISSQDRIQTLANGFYKNFTIKIEQSEANNGKSQ